MNTKLLEKVGLIFLAVILFAFGFYLGLKYKPAETKTVTNGLSNLKSSETNPEKPYQSNNLSGKDVPEIFWIKSGAEPICPEKYPIKGKLTDGQKSYYLPENKSAGRVKPDICFLNEEYAKNTAGFIRKF